jgi:hypothetical protein
MGAMHLRRQRRCDARKRAHGGAGCSSRVRGLKRSALRAGGSRSARGGRRGHGDGGALLRG